MTPLLLWTTSLVAGLLTDAGQDHPPIPSAARSGPFTIVSGWPPGVEPGSEMVEVDRLPGELIGLASITYAHPPGRPGEVWTFPSSLIPSGWVEVREALGR